MGERKARGGFPASPSRACDKTLTTLTYAAKTQEHNIIFVTFIFIQKRRCYSTLIGVIIINIMKNQLAIQTLEISEFPQ